MSRLLVHRALAGSLLAALAPVAAAAELHVPAQHATIQAAIDAASAGDTIVVAPGTYLERIDFHGKRLVIESSGGPAVTTIFADTPGTVVKAVVGEPFGTALRGLTITGASQGTLVGSDAVGYAFAGGGVLVDGEAHLALTDCVITGNTAEDGNYVSKGGGVAVLNGAVSLENCTLSGNTADRGAAIANIPPVIGLGTSSLILRDCTVTANTATGDSTLLKEAVLFEYHDVLELSDCLIADNIGNGMRVLGFADVSFQRVTFSGNTGWGYTSLHLFEVRLLDCRFLGNGLGGATLEAPQPGDAWVVVENCSFAQGDRLKCTGPAEHRISNCTFDGASVEGNGGSVDIRDSIFRNVSVPVTASGPISITWSDVEGGYPGIGNIDVDPQWVNPAAGDYSLAATSPCLDAGDPGSPLDPNGTVTDMGAVPFALWEDLGGGVPWTSKVPRLVGQGVLAAGEPVGLALTRMPAQTPVVLVVGTEALPAPFKGGVLWPSPQIVFGGLVTDTTHAFLGLGELHLFAGWPAAVPSGFTFVAQFWFEHPDAPFGFSASNAVRAVAP